MPEGLVSILAADVVGVEHQLSSLGSRHGDEFAVV